MICRKVMAARPISEKTQLLFLDPVFHLSSGTIDFFIKKMSIILKIGDDKTIIRSERVEFLEVNKTKSKNSPTLKNSQKFVRWGQWFNTRSISEKVINFEITDFSMYGDFLPKIDACFL